MNNYVKKREEIMVSDKKINTKKRLKTGSYYTPSEVAKEIILNAIEDYYKVNARDNYTYKDILKLSILDPSCGSGVFLHQFLEIIYDLSVKEAIKLEEFSEDIVDFINKHLFGVDISKEALTKCKELILLFLEQHGVDSKKCHFNFYNRDFLKMENFETVKAFDMIIGNPPYIGEKNNSDLFRNIKETPFGKKYYESKMDYFYFFIYKASEFLVTNGILAYITTSYFFTADGAKGLRQFIEENFDWLTVKDYGKAKIFSDAKISTVSYSLVKQKGTFELRYESDEKETFSTDNHCYYGQHSYIKFLKPIEKSILDKIESKCIHCLGDYFKINQGIVTGYDRKVIAKGVSEGVFVLTGDELEEKGIDKNYSFVKPFYKSSSLNHKTVDLQEKYYLLYIDEKFERESKKTKELILKHLSKYKERLEKRREVKSGARLWYQLTWPRKDEIFHSEKIVVPQRHNQMNFVYLNQSFYSSADIYFLTTIRSAQKEIKWLDKINDSAISQEIEQDYNEQSDYKMTYLTTWLNSDVLNFWYKQKGKKKGPLMEFYSTPLKIMPLPEISMYNKVIESKSHWIDVFDFTEAEKAYILQG